jgi:hypothetical protein
VGAFETCSQGPNPVRQLSCECSVFSDWRKVEQHPYQSLSVVAGVPDGTGRRARDRTGRRRRQVHGDPHSDGALIVDHRMRCGCIGAGRAAILVLYLNQDACRLPPMCGSLHLEHSPWITVPSKLYTCLCLSSRLVVPHRYSYCRAQFAQTLRHKAGAPRFFYRFGTGSGMTRQLQANQR